MTIIEKIKAEIERLKGQLIRGACAAQIEMRTMCKEEAYDEVLSFLSTLESEKPMKQDELENEAVSYCFDNGLNLSPKVATDFARHFYELGSSEKPNNHLEHVPEIKETGTQGLDEAAENYIAPIENDAGLDFINFSGRDIRDAFIAGAEWQAEKDARDMYMSDNRHFEKVYQLGRTDMRDQMMKEAVEAEISIKFPIVGRSLISVIGMLEGFRYGDKVRIIIVKED